MNKLDFCMRISQVAAVLPKKWRQRRRALGVGFPDCTRTDQPNIGACGSHNAMLVRSGRLLDPVLSATRLGAL